MAHRGERLVSPLPSNVTQTPTIESYTADGVSSDGEKLIVNSVILCTGYLYTFPFLSKSCQISLRDSYIRSLYKHIINIHHPTMSFIGVPSIVIPFPLFFTQVQFVLSYLENRLELPSKVEMVEDMRRDFKMRTDKGWPIKNAHKMEEFQWNYTHDLVKCFGVSKISEKNKILYDATFLQRKLNLPNYKKLNVNEDGTDLF